MSIPKKPNGEPLTWEELERMYPTPELEVIPIEESRPEWTPWAPSSTPSRVRKNKKPLPS